MVERIEAAGVAVRNRISTDKPVPRPTPRKGAARSWKISLAMTNTQESAPNQLG